MKEEKLGRGQRGGRKGGVAGRGLKEMQQAVAECHRKLGLDISSDGEAHIFRSDRSDMLMASVTMIADCLLSSTAGR